MAFQHMSNRSSPLQQHHTGTLPSVHVVHRFPEISSFLMLQHHGHTLDFRPGPRIPYQTCLPQPLPLAHLDNVNSVVPTCQLINALPCHAVTGAPYPMTSCQSCSAQPHSSPLVAQPQTVTATATTVSTIKQKQRSQTFPQMNVPHSPPPPTRKILATRKRKHSDNETGIILDSKYPKKETVGKIEFRPLLAASTRRQINISRVNSSNRSFLSKQSSNHTNVKQLTTPTRTTTLGDGKPCQFEFNIPFPEKPKERTPVQISYTDVFKKSRNELSEKYQKTWPTEPVPKQGYISVLEQAINHLSERCMEDAKGADLNDSNKENVKEGNAQTEGHTGSVTKESLDKAWLEVLDKVFGKSEEVQQIGFRNNVPYSSSGTSGYPSEYYSEVDWTTSTLESDYVSGAEQENRKLGSGTESDELKELLPQNFQLPPEIRESNNENCASLQPNLLCTETINFEKLDNAVGDHDYSKSNSIPLSTSEYAVSRCANDSDQSERSSGNCVEKGQINYERTAQEKENTKKVTSDTNQEDEDDYSDEEEDDIRDEQEEEKATDADVETEFMSSAEHEPPKWTFSKPRLLKRSSPKNIPKVYLRETGSDTSSGKEGFVTPTYQCNFPTSSDSEAAQGNWTPSQARKPQPPFKSPGPVDPTFRGVTVQIRTKVEKDQVQLSVKGFFNCRKKSKQRSEYIIGQGTKSSSDSDSNSNSDVYRKRKRRSYQSGKQCASCCTKKTPLWRDAEDGTPLCNACGIRYKKYRVKCHSCWNIPRKDVKMNSTCTNCGESLRLSAMRNPAKFWT